MRKNARGEYFFEGRARGMISSNHDYIINRNALENAITSSPFIDDAMVSEYYDKTKFGAMPLIYVI